MLLAVQEHDALTLQDVVQLGGSFVIVEPGAVDVHGVRPGRGLGGAVFVAAGAEHRFTGYEELSVLVVFDKRAL